MTVAPHFFAHDKALRDARCVQKDAIIADVISRLDIKPGFTATLMPALHGPEVDLLAARGVSLDRMFAIEQKTVVRAAQAQRGLRVPHKALSAHKAVDEIPFEHLDFCYLDFWGRPGANHLECIRKLVRLGLLVPGTCLLVTLGANRGCQGSTPVVTLDGNIRASDWAEAALAMARGLQPRRVMKHEYTSVASRTHTARYFTTEIQF